MKTRIMNMIKITNPATGEVVVLDKVKKEGWEGLTFPGGKVEEGESLIESAIREAKEETGLDIENPIFVGFISWKGEEFTDVGLLFETSTYKGELITHHREGDLRRIDYDKFKKMDGMSLSMDKIFKIYEGEVAEVFWDVTTDTVTEHLK